ncbi:MAG: molybdopterin-dependent oxidoreductase [Rhodoblastus sp.]
MSAQTIKTTCPYCGTGCGVTASVGARGAVEIAGDPDHPANFGRLCVKGAALGATLGDEDRLLFPQIGEKRASWPAALDLVARRFARTIEAHGPDSVAFYVSGQILTEDYYVANKLMKGFIGSGNIDTNSRLCMAASVAGHRRAFGADIVPGVYEDMENADLVVLVGSNLAWCHPVLFQRLNAAREKRGGRPVVVNIDPRRTATSEIADLHLAIAPGADVALFLGLLRHLSKARVDKTFVEDHTQGMDAALAAAAQWTPGAVARRAGLALADVERFYEMFAATEKSVTVYSQGVNQSSAGVDKVNSIINCHLLTGRIGKPGCGPFSVTGQPNAMGGREVGGLANQLAAHMEIDNPDHRALVQDFWKSPAIATRAGLKAVDMFDAIGDGRIKAVWIMGTNPVDSLPDANRAAAALAACPFVVVSDVVARTDTTKYAHVLLPAQAWGEKDGTVTNSERRISRQRPLRAAVGEAMPDWWAMAAVARRMGFGAAFDFSGPAAIFREHAALSGYRNNGARDFDISALAGVSNAQFETLAPFQWPWRASEVASEAPKRFFADKRFYTSNGRARFVATPFRGLAGRKGAANAFVLNTGRIRDQWHTMTRTGVAARLSQHIAEPFAEIHPKDAARIGVAAAGLVRLTNAHGAVTLRALVTDRQREGSIFAPIHWTDQFASSARVDALVAPALDPISGQPESKGAYVAAKALAPDWFAFALAREKPTHLDADYWAVARTDGGWRIELAGNGTVDEWEARARDLFGVATDDDVFILSARDARAGSYRCVAVRDGAVIGLLLVAREPIAAARAWLCELFADPASDPAIMLAGRPGAQASDPGQKICVCFNVGANAIRDAVARGCRDIAAVGEATAAGTGCGSCRPEIGRLLKSAIDQSETAQMAAMAK